jgi:hypothetical protein
LVLRQNPEECYHSERSRWEGLAPSTCREVRRENIHMVMTFSKIRSVW